MNPASSVRRIFAIFKAKISDRNEMIAADIEKSKFEIR